MNAEDLLLTLASVNPTGAEEPPDAHDATSQQQALNFQDIVEAIVGPTRMNGGQDARFLQGFTIPKNALIDPENPLAGLLLSKFARLFTIMHPWDVKPEILEPLAERLQAAGFTYVPFTLFADQRTYHWKDVMAADSSSGLLAWQVPFRHEELFDSLFGYM
jgi:hypothetical protein